MPPSRKTPADPATRATLTTSDRSTLGGPSVPAAADGGAAIENLMTQGSALDFVRDQYRHCKPILVFGTADALLKKLSILGRDTTGEPDPALVFGESDSPGPAVEAFFVALGKHRNFARETDPPVI